MSGVDIPSLRAFVAICEHRSVTEAGHQLGLTQAAVSQRLKNLEREVRTPLIDRRQRPLELTAAGQVMLVRARNVLSKLDSMTIDISGPSGIALPELSLGIADTFGMALVPSLVQELKGTFLKLSIRVDSSSTVCRLLIDRHLHAAISCDSLVDRDDLERHDIVREPLILVLKKNSSPSHFDAFALRKLSTQLPFIRYTPLSPLARQIEAHLHRLGIKPPRHLEFNASEAIIQSVAGGLGWTITTPLCIVQSRVSFQEVDVHRLPTSELYRTVTLLARKNELGRLPRRLSEASQRIIKDEVIGRISDVVPWLALEVQTPPNQEEDVDTISGASAWVESNSPVLNSRFTRSRSTTLD